MKLLSKAELCYKLHELQSNIEKLETENLKLNEINVEEAIEYNKLFQQLKTLENLNTGFERSTKLVENLKLENFENFFRKKKSN